MSELEQPAPERQPAQGQAPSIIRRRALLRGLGASSVAVAGAATPLTARATYSGNYCRHPTTQKCHQATVSGCQSVIMSLAPNNPNDCKGHKCSHYSTPSNWPTGCNNGYNRNFDCNTKFYLVFECQWTTMRNRTLLDLCTNYPTSDEAHFACAIANAKKRSPFPYTQKQVVDYHNSTDLKIPARDFFSTFMETLT